MKKQERLQIAMEEADARSSEFMSLLRDDYWDEDGEAKSPQEGRDQPNGVKGRIGRLLKDD